MSTTTDQQFQQLMAEAQDDPAIIGLVLGGSRGKDFHAPHSDYDLLLIVRDEGIARYRARYPQQRTAFGDLILLSPSDFAAYAAWGSATHWARYGLAGAKVQIDRDGSIAPLVAAKGAVPQELRLPLVRGALDAYINGVYRSAKCWRNGNRLGARLEAADSLGHLLTVIFALEGRHQPYHGYLERELRAVPLRSFPLAADELLAMFDAILTTGDLAIQQQLLGAVEGLCRAAGLDDVFDDHWGDDYPWMKTYGPTDRCRGRRVAQCRVARGNEPKVPADPTASAYGRARCGCGYWEGRLRVVRGIGLCCVDVHWSSFARWVC